MNLESKHGQFKPLDATENDDIEATGGNKYFISHYANIDILSLYKSLPLFHN